MLLRDVILYCSQQRKSLYSKIFSNVDRQFKGRINRNVSTHSHNTHTHSHNTHTHSHNTHTLTLSLTLSLLHHVCSLHNLRACFNVLAIHRRSDTVSVQNNHTRTSREHYTGSHSNMLYRVTIATRLRAPSPCM